MSKTLEELRQELWNDFGKTTRWQLLCKNQRATTEARQRQLAEQVLAEPATKSVAEWLAAWTSLYEIADPQLEILLKKLNLAKLLYFQALCHERNAASATDQMRIAQEVAAWSGAFDTAGAFRSAWHYLTGARPISVDDYLNSRLPQP